jgi:tetratricopeptide (TPR) repeat protein
LYITVQMATYSKQDMLSDLQTEFAVNTPRGENSNSIDSLLQSFNDQRFADVIKHYKSLINPTVREQFLTGYAYQQTGQYDTSAIMLEKLLQQNKLQNESLYNDDAEYYLAMAAIELNQPAKAYTLLKAIHENEQHTYHEKVDRKLLWKLWWMK